MKLRSLFLAGLAVMAMASCSNEDDAIVNDKQQVEKSALIQFQLGFAQSGTRASVAGTDQVGTADENQISSVIMVLDYPGTNIARQVCNYQLADFSANANKTLYTLKSEENVAPGNATVTVLVNSNAAIDSSTDLSTIESAATYETSLDALTAKNGIAEAGKFLMTGKKPAIIAPNQKNEITVQVARVAAKLEERSAKTFTTNDQAYNITLNDYTFMNLNTKTYQMADKGAYASTEEGFFQHFVANKTQAVFNESTAIKTITGAPAEDKVGQITYCMENSVAAAPTTIVYKATATFTDETHQTAAAAEGTGNIYKYKGLTYASFDDLNKIDDFQGSLSNAPYNLSKNSTFEDFIKYGIQLYKGGVCYYTAKIETGTSNYVITRNNWYKLSVSTIATLGDPGFDTPIPEIKTTLKLTVEVMPWKVWNNDIEL